jgi:putative hydrolase of the HAD superfamily
MPGSIKLLIFDLDDTLIDTSGLFFDIKVRFFLRLQLRGFKASDIVRTYDEIDTRNISLYGYVSERSIVSMRETMESLYWKAGRHFKRGDLEALVRIGSPCLSKAPPLFPGAKRLLAWCHGNYRLALLTRGSLSLQSVKVASHRLARYFEVVRVVSAKDQQVFEDLLRLFKCKPASAVSIGDSPRFDILPALDLGMNAIYAKYPWPDRQWKHDKMINGGRAVTGPLAHRGRDVPTAMCLKDVRTLLGKF